MRDEIPLAMRQAMNEGDMKRRILKRQAEEREADDYASKVAKEMHGARSSSATLPFTRGQIRAIAGTSFRQGRIAGASSTPDQKMHAALLEYFHATEAMSRLDNAGIVTERRKAFNRLLKARFAVAELIG